MKRGDVIIIIIIIFYIKSRIQNYKLFRFLKLKGILKQLENILLIDMLFEEDSC